MCSGAIMHGMSVKGADMSEDLSDEISDFSGTKQTDELVIGLVGAVGAGVTKTGECIAEILEIDYGYDARIITASNLIKRAASDIYGKVTPESGSERINSLQESGNRLRDEFGADFVVRTAIEQIATDRIEHGFKKDCDPPEPKARRIVTIVDSLKHPKESEVLRSVYGKLYWQFTVFAPEDVRESRLKAKGVSKQDISKIFSRDENDEFDYGQNVEDTAHRSDFFLRNDAQTDDKLRVELNRFVGLMFQAGVATPTIHETGMYEAKAAALKSGCLSRQVGAAIYSLNGELIGVGWNDVPKHGGSLYGADDHECDNRCYRWKNKECHNDLHKEALYSDIRKRFIDEDLISPQVPIARVREILRKTDVKNLIEYSRSIHAEMEAIISVGRGGKSGLVGSTLYTTTFPCHNCARHIVAAGISAVYYVEPYSKSLAMELHDDAISIRESAGKSVSFFAISRGWAACDAEGFRSSERAKTGRQNTQTGPKKVVSDTGAFD